MSKKTDQLSQVKDLIRGKGLEEEFLKASGLDSLDELDPKNFSEFKDQIPQMIMKPTTSAAPVPHKALPKSAADATTGFTPRSASDMLRPYVGLKINYRSRKTQSSYAPSALMMDYIVHQINSLLVDNFYFRRACPDYHPYVIRLYYGVLFWIQCLRAGNFAKSIDAEAHQTLNVFLDAFPPESLPISGPLVDLFKTLCCSQPEIPTYGKVFPSLPMHPGPELRSSFINGDPQSHVLPNIPGIFALLADLNAKLNPGIDQQAVFPAKGKHIPVTSTAAAATIFGHHSFPIPANRSAAERWSLVSSGLQYPCEADKKLHENFAERIDNFDFPPTAQDDNLQTFHCFLHINRQLAWFAQVRDVAAAEASFFEGSGTLADCAPFGITANQVIVQYCTPPTLPTAPTHSADSAAQFPFAIKLKTNARSLPELSEAMAATAQSNIHMFPTHPFLANIGVTTLDGPFWDIRPTETSFKDETSFFSLREIIRGLMKPKG
uniref:Capsid protein n=1 Tax=Pear alphapartitivirus TaxID=1968821 RepID=A0A292GDS5_9VIRU|nr:capsid protein [Pear alphapartitivirus]